MRNKRITLLSSVLVPLAFIFSTVNTVAGEKFITIASTTSTDNSGLFDILLPAFTDLTGITARVVAVGTGQAIKLASNGDADILFVHHKPSEDKFIENGLGVKRFDVMYNDFVLIGPGKDSAGASDSSSITQAFQLIAQTKSPFVSRGDDSGTHKKEVALWELAELDITGKSPDWYRESGSGMGATLNIANGMGAYALTDRATWLNFKNKGDLEILFEGDERLFNQYGIILVNDKVHQHIKTEQAQRFIDWVLSKQGQNIISTYQIQGQQAFFANAQSGVAQSE